MKLLICSSSVEEIDKKYLNNCDKYLDDLFKLNNDLVFGAYNKGLMNISYEKALKYKRDVIGITPKIFENDLKNLNCTRTIITNNINERTSGLINEADALIYLPGGIGTIYELFTAIESKRSGEFNKPLIIYNCCGYFDKLLEFLELVYQEKFASNSIRECYYISENSNDTIEYLNKYFRKDQKNEQTKR